MRDNWEKIGNSIIYKYDFKNHVTFIKICREKQLNALNKDVIDSLEEVLDCIEKEPQIRSVIITGEGEKAFVAGADIKEFKSFKKEEANNLSKQGKNKLFNKIANFNKPIIAAINGYALGGGLELALSCHIRVANTRAILGLPECKLGLIPGYGATQRLPRIIGLGYAMEMILTSKILKSEEAHRIGLVNYSVEPEELMNKCLSIVDLINKTSPEALAAAIRSVNSAFSNDGDNIETIEFGQLFETDNFKEGTDAFLEKRSANFNK
tara:strand:- start:4902 stop:5699 length:798 start_codon:yes stop_codon:yes gene_type:complete